MKSRIVLLALLATLFLCSIASAEVPKMINYQGVITDQGQPLTDTIPIFFAIYADSIGGSSLWSETHPHVVVKNGLFNVLLGSVNPIADSVFSGQVRYLGMMPKNHPEMSPRVKIVSTPYAIRSNYSEISHFAKQTVIPLPHLCGYYVYANIIPWHTITTIWIDLDHFGGPVELAVQGSVRAWNKLRLFNLTTSEVLSGTEVEAGNRDALLTSQFSPVTVSSAIGLQRAAVNTGFKVAFEIYAVNIYVRTMN